MNVRNSILRDAETGGDGGTNGGGSGAPAQPSQANVGVWGNEPAPDWTKGAGVDKAHVQVEPKVPARTVPGTQAPTQAEQGAADTPAVPAQPVATQPATPAAAQPSLTADAIAEAFAKIQNQNASREAQGQPKLTEEQIRQQLGIYTMTDADYEAITGVKPDSPQRVAEFNRVLQAVAKQAATIANVLNERSLSQFRESMNPYTSAVREQQATAQKQLFFTEHKDLVGYDALVEKEYQLVVASGKKFPDIASARKFLADQVRATLKSVGITPNAASGSGNNQRPTSSPAGGRSMTTTLVGGRSGGSAGGQKTANTNEAVWGKR